MTWQWSNWSCLVARQEDQTKAADLELYADGLVETNVPRIYTIQDQMPRPCPRANSTVALFLHLEPELLPQIAGHSLASSATAHLGGRHHLTFPSLFLTRASHRPTQNSCVSPPLLIRHHINKKTVLSPTSRPPVPGPRYAAARACRPLEADCPSHRLPQTLTRPTHRSTTRPSPRPSSARLPSSGTTLATGWRTGKRPIPIPQ